MNAIAPVLSPEISLGREALDEADGDRERAVRKLVDRLMADDGLRREHLHAMVKIWADQTVARALKGYRTRIYEIASGNRFVDALKNAAHNEAIRLMDAPLFGGKPLGMATSAEVRDSANQYIAHAKTMGVRGRWQIAVAEEAEKNASGGEKSIREILSEKTLQSLWEQANAK